MTDRVKTLEQDVEKLDEKELMRFAKWFANYQDRLWEKQITKDAVSGRLDFLIEEAQSERAKNSLSDLVQ